MVDKYGSTEKYHFMKWLRFHNEAQFEMNETISKCHLHNIIVFHQG